MSVTSSVPLGSRNQVLRSNYGACSRHKCNHLFHLVLPQIHSGNDSESLLSCGEQWERDCVDHSDVQTPSVTPRER